MKTEKINKILAQGFIPIMVDDKHKTETLVDAALECGCAALEYTCRRKDAAKYIPALKKKYPELIILGASLVDGDNAQKFLKSKYEHFITADEMADLGVDGLVSFVRFQEKTYSKHADRLIMIPGVSTHNEALEEIEKGADIIKITGDNPWGPGFISGARAATHGLFPFLVTGGMTDARIHEYVRAGAALTAGGFDLILKDAPGAKSAAEALRKKLDAVKAARAGCAVPAGGWIQRSLL
jgi:2-keto-3-deoxy-6-phosphogluconate aldolase